MEYGSLELENKLLRKEVDSLRTVLKAVSSSRDSSNDCFSPIEEVTEYSTYPTHRSASMTEMPWNPLAFPSPKIDIVPKPITGQQDLISMKEEIEEELYEIEQSMKNLRCKDIKIKKEMQKNIDFLKRSIEKISETIENNERQQHRPKKSWASENQYEESLLFQELTRLRKENFDLKEELRATRTNSPVVFSKTSEDFPFGSQNSTIRKNLSSSRYFLQKNNSIKSYRNQY
ncbi:unnamed protein product [Blepharisma stoltei]|uniref:Uncharacterized protein n=1 Tax=Blepharisma stoltei TaxID=1481888 RepID=A0AAU9J4T6_9CILI|nr:unnamed protein product [Blepharisma stoltei]